MGTTEFHQGVRPDPPPCRFAGHMIWPRTPACRRVTGRDPGGCQCRRGSQMSRVSLMKERSRGGREILKV